MTLTEFLLARIAEDEAVVREMDRWPLTGHLFIAYEDEGGVSRFADYRPARVLAECEAKRRIVERYVDTTYIDPTPSNAYDLALFHVMRDIAAVYADHPDYRDEWRP